LEVIDTEYAFDRAGSYVYVRADATTADTLSGWQDLFLWGALDKCGGLFFGLINGRLFVGQQCNAAYHAVDLAVFAPVASTRYVFEVYFRDATKELRIWVDGTEVTPPGTRDDGLTWTDGYASVGSGGHGAIDEDWGGAVHALSFYECVAPLEFASPVTTYDTGVMFTCGTNGDGEVLCWGVNSQSNVLTGELGDGSGVNSRYFVGASVSGIASPKSVSCAYQFCCAVVDGAVKCWGRNEKGQIGDGTETSALTPKSVPGVDAASFARCGRAVCCAVLENATALCWGNSDWGEIGDQIPGVPIGAGPAAVQDANEDVMTGIVDIGPGDDHTCALLSTGEVKCWGYQATPNGALGDGRGSINSVKPVTVAGLTGKAKSLSVGLYHSCVVIVDGTVMCWGQNTYGAIGDGTTAYKSSAEKVINLPAGNPVTSVSCGSFHTCVTLQDGGVMCWGYNHMGQIGQVGQADGKIGEHFSAQTTSTSSPPNEAIYGIDSAISVSAGNSHTCAALEDGSMRCWGQMHGLGIGSATGQANIWSYERNVPTEVPGFSFLPSGEGFNRPYGYVPTCAPVLDVMPSGDSLRPFSKQRNVVVSYAFPASADRTLYARLDLVWTTPTTTMIFLLWGGSGTYSCGGWRLGFTGDGEMFMDSQCNGPSGTSGKIEVPEPFTDGARYVFEYYYDQVSAKAKMWSTCLSSCGADEVPGALVELTPEWKYGTSLSFADGPISVGFDAHAQSYDSVRGFMGTMYSVLLSDCAPPVGLDALKVHLVADDLDAAYRPETWVDRVAWQSFLKAQSTTEAPALVNGAIHGHNALRFGINDAGDVIGTGLETLDAHEVFASVPGQTGVTVFVVYRPFAVGTVIDFPILFEWGAIGSTGFGFASEVNGDTRLWTPEAYGGAYPESAFAVADATYIAAIRVKFHAGTGDPGYQLVASQNGDVAVGDVCPKVAHAVTGFTATNMMDAFSFGFQANAIDRDTRFFKGDVAEFRWYADLLSDADVETVQLELSGTYLPYFSKVSLKSAVDNCIAATVNPDLTLYPSCVAPAVPSGSGRFCCSRCGADCLNGGATDMPGWDVSRVVSFEGLFQDKTSFDEDLSSWDVSSVTNMERTFLGATAFNSPIGDWNVASVTTMDSMFQDASAFDANITGWSSPQSSQNMFLGATAFLAKFANCNTTATSIDLNACRRKVYPPSLAAFDGPPAAWDNRHCDFSASVVANGALGECNSSDVPKGSMCAPTCYDSTALVVKGVCGHKKQTPPACVCECKDKRAAFGFNVAP
jgi:surface protein